MQCCYNVEQCKVLIAENKVVIDKLNAKLRHAEEELQTSNKRMNMCFHSMHSSQLISLLYRTRGGKEES